MDDRYAGIDHCQKGREGKEGKRVLGKTGKNQTRKRGEKIERRRKKIEGIAEKRVGS